MDPISDMLTRIRNAYARNKKTVSIPYSRYKNSIVMVLVKHGYLKKAEITEITKVKREIKIALRYNEGKPAIEGIRKISRLGQRIYSGSQNSERWGGRRGMIVLSTSKGILPHWEAKKKKLGGEVVCVVY